MKKKITLTIALIACLAAHSFAAQVLTRLSSDKRIAVVAYRDNNVIPIHGTTFIATHIQFGQDEVIRDIQSGDLAAWTSNVDNNVGNMLFIKPTAYDSHSNMTVITNKHTYYFELFSNKAEDSPDQISTYALKFFYPEDKKTKEQKALNLIENQKKSDLSAFKHPGDYHWDYSFHGDTRLVPLHVFDDGTFTYFQLQSHQVIPAVFSIDHKDGKESVVNARRDGDYLIIQRVAPQFTLRSGKAMVASIFNQRVIDQLKNGDVRRG